MTRVKLFLNSRSTLWFGLTNSFPKNIIWQITVINSVWKAKVVCTTACLQYQKTHFCRLKISCDFLAQWIVNGQWWLAHIPRRWRPVIYAFWVCSVPSQKHTGHLWAASFEMHEVRHTIKARRRRVCSVCLPCCRVLCRRHSLLSLFGWCYPRKQLVAVVVAALCWRRQRVPGGSKQKAHTATRAAGIPPWTLFANAPLKILGRPLIGRWNLLRHRLVVFGQIFWQPNEITERRLFVRWKCLCMWNELEFQARVFNCMR